jgi:SAM-dependent methyltransferase
MEHVPDPVAAFRELARLLKRGGTLIVTAPFASLTHFAPYHYCSGFNRYFYEYWLPRLGLDIELIEPNGDFIEFLHQELLWVRKLPRPAGMTRRGAALATSAVAIAAALALRCRFAQHATAPELLCFGYHVRARRPMSGASPREPQA